MKLILISEMIDAIEITCSVGPNNLMEKQWILTNVIKFSMKALTRTLFSFLRF